jgi:DNA-directed RNA polymerase subunit RPC12/RpoP
MASWALKCSNCGEMFTHSPIPDDITNYFWPAKPSFPQDGMKLDCPHCGQNANYQASDLTYQK